MATTIPPRMLVITCLANAIEWYDFAVYGAMAAVLVDVLLPPGTGSGGLVAVFAVFATSFLARPVGAVVVGLRADRSGRRGRARRDGAAHERRHRRHRPAPLVV